MTWNDLEWIIGYFRSNSVFVPAVLLRAFTTKKRMKINAVCDKNEGE